MASGIRQQPGLACEECRRRKTRCDRGRPRCGTCAETDAACAYNEKRTQRGPKKGQLKALRTQVATLERQLSDRLGYFDPSFDTITPDLNIATPALPILDSLEYDGDVLEIAGSEIAIEQEENAPEPPDLTGGTSASSDYTGWSDWNQGPLIMSSGLTASSGQTTSNTPHLVNSLADVSGLVQADLDQLYFDRVHPVAPIIHKRRYFAWAAQENPSPARVCLRSAMRTIATVVSTQFRGLSDPLYAETRRMVGSLDESDAPWLASKIQLEQIQAWLLLAHYEFLCKHEHQAMLTAGRALRLVQLSRLNDVDATGASSVEFGAAAATGGSADEDRDEEGGPRETAKSPAPSLASRDAFVKTEEKRRTFWLAYCLDRFFLIRSEWPLTLHEDMIRARLPAPETNFQNCHPIRMDFLPAALANNGRSVLPPFAESIVLGTLLGRCMTHRRLALATALSGNDSREFWGKHNWLSTAVETRKQALLRSAPVASQYFVDPMLTFAHALAHSAAIHLSNTAESRAWQTVEHQLMVMASEERAFEAAGELVRLAEAMPRFSCFKAHPLLPCALARAVVFFMTHAKTADFSNPTYGEGDEEVGVLLRGLRTLQDVSNLARELVKELEADGSRMP